MACARDGEGRRGYARSCRRRRALAQRAQERVRREIIQAIPIEEERFGFEPEITVKLARQPGIRIYEVPISYRGRRYEVGKKIGLKDAFRALYCLTRYARWRAPTPSRGSADEFPGRKRERAD